MELLYSSETNVGIKKNTNQDSLLLKSCAVGGGRITMMAVCDGMGGLLCGEKASATVIKSFDRWFERSVNKEFLASFDTVRITDEFNTILQNDNLRLTDYGKSNGISLGTTCTVMIFNLSKYLICHVGDTRVYEINNEIKQLTEDQTFVAREMREGRMSEKQALSDPRRNVLLQCIGASKVVTPQFLSGDVNKGAVYIVCSDGFRHVISASEILKAYNPAQIKSNDDLKKASISLINLVMKRKEEDNISVSAIKITG